MLIYDQKITMIRIYKQAVVKIKWTWVETSLNRLV